MLSAGAGKSNVFETVAAAAAGVLQLKTAVKTDTFVSTSASFIDITGVTVKITPTADDSKILILLDYKGTTGVEGVVSNYLQLLRDASVILTIGNVGNPDGFVNAAGCMFLDNPATTSEVDYQVQGSSGGGTWGCNRTRTSATDRCDTIITAIEISAGVL